MDNASMDNSSIDNAPMDNASSDGSRMRHYNREPLTRTI